MKAVEVKRQLDSKIDGVVDAIAFCYGENYKEDILDRMSELNYYVYDNEDYQIDRLVNVELFTIAKQFARDISDKITLNDKEKDKLNDELANIIIDASDLANSDEFIRQRLSQINELKNDIEKYIVEFKGILNYFINDYEVKSISKTVDQAFIKRKKFDVELIKYKKLILNKKFKVSLKISDEEVIKIWNLLDAFNPSLEQFMSVSYEYKNEVLEMRKEFYKLIGCDSVFEEDIFEEAKLKGLQVKGIDYLVCKNMYENLFEKLMNAYFLSSSNLNEIFEDLYYKNYSFNDKAISTFLVEKVNVYGANFPCYDDLDKVTSFIVFCNNMSLYSKEFNETFIHEVIHYLGGINPNISKSGLQYNKDMRYYHLEEAFTNCLAKEIKEIYTKENGYLVTPVNDSVLNPKYDKTLSYMKEVFKLYKDELIEIQFSRSIDQGEAMEICPIANIADSVSRIMESSDEHSEEISQKEIAKLTRGQIR